MKRHAVVDGNGVVHNVILWDGASAWAPPEGMSVVEAEGVFFDIGWKWENGAFTAPPPPEPLTTETPAQ